MQIDSFDWNENNEMHIAKHRVFLEEAEEVFAQDYFCRKTRQGRYLGLGQTLDGRYLTIVYVMKSKGKARVITARDMDEKELKLYKKWRGGKLK